MIITQAPLRISFLGGGTDFPEFYAQEEGCVLSSAIDKSITVILKRRYDQRIRVGYTRTELVETVDQLEHELVREAMRLTGLTGGVEIGTMGDIPSRGSGLGSSSTVTVALLHAMWTYLGVLPTRGQLAEEAVRVEREILGRPIGVQDQYAAAFGGLRFHRFGPEGVSSEAVLPDGAAGEQLARRLGEHLLIFFTGITRQSASVLAEQRANIETQRPLLRAMARQAREGRQALVDGRLDDLGELLHEGWLLKRRLASKVTNPDIDAMYAAARGAGAIGGKISGAGGGGFLLLYARPQDHQAVRAALHPLSELAFNLEPEGSLVLLHQRRR